MFKVVVVLVSGLAATTVEPSTTEQAALDGSFSYNVGESFYVDLENSPATGYQWDILAQPDCVKHVGSTTLHTEAKALVEVMGRPHILRYFFIGSETCSGIMSFRQVRRWEAEEKKRLARVYQYSIDIV